MSVMNATLVAHIAKLANIPISKDEEQSLAAGFVTTLRVVDALLTVDIGTLKPAHQVTGLENVWREDVVDTSRTFSQEEALANASRTHDGYFVVPQLVGE